MKVYPHLRRLVFILFIALSFSATAQTTILAGDFKTIEIGDNGYGDYTRSLILLHKIYNGTLIDHNYAVGTITAMRGQAVAGNRQNIIAINTSSSYNSTTASTTSNDDYTFWSLKTCIYNGSKYLAVDVPYHPAYHNWGYTFTGRTVSTGESMKCVSYEVNGSPVNQSVLSNIQDFAPNMVETHLVAGLNVIGGKLGVGTSNPDELLTVRGKIHANEVKVDMSVLPDYVFHPSYNLASLKDVKSYIDKNHHLPEVPSAQEVAKDGLKLGEMNAILLKKVEELTLYLIEKDKQLIKMENRLTDLEQMQINNKQQEQLKMKQKIYKSSQYQINKLNIQK